MLRGVVRAVAAAHAQRVYLCDLKSANILRTPGRDVQPKITDFGLSTVESLPEGADVPGRPQGWSQVGTPMSWPPEAHRPFAEHKSALFDVFTIGVIWYHLLVERIERPRYAFEDTLRVGGRTATQSN
jgi:serine/threonine protein kinase